MYFDNAATTKVDIEVFNHMKKFFVKEYGNPDAKYYPLALNAKQAVKQARIQISSLLGCKLDEVVFNSGASEGNNHVIQSVFKMYKETKPHFITTKIEHSSVLEVFKYLEEIEKCEVTYLKVDGEGLINLESLENSIKTNTVLCSIGYVNSEIATIQDILAISEICKNHNVLMHSDFTQAIGKLRVNLSDYPGIKFITFSSHKIHGPKGIGALIIRKDLDGIKFNLPPLVYGGSQEGGLRAGTSPVGLMVGFGKACEILNRDLDDINLHLTLLDSHFTQKVTDLMNKEMILNNDFKHRTPGIINVRFIGYNSQILLKNAANIFSASTGSACSNTKPSYVLKSIGRNDTEIRESIRFSFSKYNTVEEIDRLFIELFQ